MRHRAVGYPQLNCGGHQKKIVLGWESQMIDHSGPEVGRDPVKGGHGSQSQSAGHSPTNAQNSKKLRDADYFRIKIVTTVLNTFVC